MKINKKIVIMGIILLVVALLAVVFFSVKSNKSKKKEDKNNYTLKFDYYEESQLVKRVTLIYSDKKLKDMTLTLYFDSKETAKNAYKVYKSAKEYDDYKVEKNRLILTFTEDDIFYYKTLSKEEIIALFEEDGFLYTK